MVEALVMRPMRVVLLCVAGVCFLFFAIAFKPSCDRSRADYEKVIASDGGAVIGGHRVLPR